MKKDTAKYKVLIKRCETYDRDKIRNIVSSGMKELGFQPAGKVYVKPNVVFASKNGQYGSTAYTQPSVVGGSLLALSAENAVTRVDLGEKTAIGYPTRLNYKYAGYYKEIKAVRKQATRPVGIFCIDEEKRDRVFVGGYVHDTLRISRKMARADQKVYLPKLKCHCVSTMTGAVKLNIGICCDDERAIRHDFLLNEKIVDLMVAGEPDFIVMDAIDVGVGNEAVPAPRKLGLIIMGDNPVAVDIVGARLLGHNLDEVPYLKRCVERGYLPSRLEDIEITGDLTSFEDLDEAAKRIQPYDEDFYKWQDIEKELKRLNSPIRFYWGVSQQDNRKKCKTGCVMGAKMFFAFQERYAGADAFREGNPAVIVIGKVDETIDAGGDEVFLIGSCADAKILNAKNIVKIDNCFTTAVDIVLNLRGKLGMKSPALDPREIGPLVLNTLIASWIKTIKGRYLQDIGSFFKRGLQKRI